MPINTQLLIRSRTLLGWAALIAAAVWSLQIAHGAVPSGGEAGNTGIVLAPTGSVAPTDGGTTRPGEVVRGTGALFAPPAAAATAAAGDADNGFQLNFTDAPIATIAATVLGDGLGVPYFVDPQVKGTMTLQATRPLSREEMLAAFETALRVQDAALVDVNGVLNVVPIRSAPQRVTSLRVPGQDARGFGITIVPLQYISAAEMEKVLQPFATEGAILRVDAARNLLLLAGTGQQLATWLGVVSTFDVDWLSGMSFALYPLDYVDAATLSGELADVFSNAGNPIAGVVRLVPLSRLNSIMVVTPQPNYLAQVEAWIKRLDIAAATPGRRIYVYDVQNGKADDLAASLSSILAIDIELPAGAPSAATTPAAAPGSATAAPPRTAAPRSAGGGGTGDVRIVPNEENNSLLILATPSEYGVIDAALKRLDVVPIQVLIEASIAEVTLTDNLRYGLQWSYLGDRGPITLSETGSAIPAQLFPGLSALYTGRTDIRAVLNAIESLTNVRVISSPKLMVVNNREAQLQIGDQVPIAVQSAVSTSGGTAPIVNSVQLRDTGVILRVTPRANRSGRVMLEISQEVSDVIPTTTSGIDSPTIQQRKLSSIVSVADGETVALGGMIRESRSNGGSGIPYLRRIPLLGQAFGSTAKNSLRTELIVLLTPKVIRSTAESDQTMQELRDQFRRLQSVMPSWTGAASRPAPNERQVAGEAIAK